MNQSIAIVDYGMANLRSVQKAFAFVGAEAKIISRPEEVAAADRIVLPGVGAFKDAIAVLRQTGLADAVKEHIAKDRPFLGICLGLQLLFDVGYDGEFQGLGVLRGQSHPLRRRPNSGPEVPHMGWNQLIVRRPSPLLKVFPGAGVYFVHGYHVVPDDPNLIATETDYGRPFVSSIWRDNLMATQFHPEKSQRVGMRILANFAAI